MARRAGIGVVAELIMADREMPLTFATARDAPAIAAMSRDLIEAGLGWEYRQERIARMIGKSDVTAVAARDDGRVAGFALMNIGHERAHLALLAVLPVYQRRGVARRMVAWLVESAVTAGVASIHVELRAANVAAYALYRDAGFSETVREPGYYAGRETAVRMLRLIRAPDAPLPAWQPPWGQSRTR